MRGRRLTLGLPLAAIALSVALLAPTALPIPGLAEGPWAAWVTQTVDTDFWSVPLGIDTLPDGRPVISYSWTGLNIATQTPLGTWNIETIHTGSTRASDIAVDAPGTIHVAFVPRSYDPIYSFDLAYATNQGGTWTTERIYTVTNGVSVEAARIALAPDGTPHIFYDGPSSEKWYATPDGNGGWTTERVTTDAHAHIDIAVDSTGTPHVTYDTQNTITHSKRASTGWIKTTVPRCESYPSIAVDANDLAHIACKTPHFDGLGLVHAYETSPGTWAWEEAIHGNELTPPRSADSIAYENSIAIHHDTGAVHIATRTLASFSATSPAQPIYATKTLTGWSVNTIDAASHLNGLEIDLAIDRNGIPHVAYGLGSMSALFACEPIVDPCYDLQYARPATALPEAILPLDALP